MRIIQARNAHQALAQGIQTLFTLGVPRESRNGPVLQMPTPVTTVYERPMERVVFWSQRDANPFFHLYEAMWMLAGRNDVEGVARYAKQMREYSDDGVTMNGSAYGFRWRHAFDPVDQLDEVIAMLKKNPNERRAVLQMWDCSSDLGSSSKDVPCNTMATVQINTEGALDLTVFCRSNDVVWGAYGANAVHFSVLLEYLARSIGVPVGRYYQVSVNWHGYLSTATPLRDLGGHAMNMADPYDQGLCAPVELMPNGATDWFNTNLYRLLEWTDHELLTFEGAQLYSSHPFFHTFYVMMLAHQLWRVNKGSPSRYEVVERALDLAPVNIDWIRAGKEWMARRRLKEATRGSSKQA